MSSPATTEAVHPGVNSDLTAPTQDYNPHALVGSLLDEEEEPIPFLYFNSIPEAWVSQLRLVLLYQSFLEYARQLAYTPSQ